MRRRDEKLLRERMRPIAKEVGQLFIDAMVLRVSWHLVTAEEHGAEPEDAPKIIADAIDSGAEGLRLALDKISERENAEAWNKAHKSNRKT